MSCQHRKMQMASFTYQFIRFPNIAKPKIAIYMPFYERRGGPYTKAGQDLGICIILAVQCSQISCVVHKPTSCFLHALHHLWVCLGAQRCFLHCGQWKWLVGFLVWSMFAKSRIFWASRHWAPLEWRIQLAAASLRKLLPSSRSVRSNDLQSTFMQCVLYGHRRTIGAILDNCIGRGSCLFSMGFHVCEDGIVIVGNPLPQAATKNVTSSIFVFYPESGSCNRGMWTRSAHSPQSGPLLNAVWSWGTCCHELMLCCGFLAVHCVKHMLHALTFIIPISVVLSLLFISRCAMVVVTRPLPSWWQAIIAIICTSVAAGHESWMHD